MALLLAGAAIFVATGIAISLLMILPATALAETAGEFDAAGRARAWLAALILPPVVGAATTAHALSLFAQGTVASPHIGGLRPHLCLLPLLNAPAGAFALRAFAWLALLLVVAALVRLIASAISSHLLRQMMVSTGAPIEEVPGSPLVIDLERPVSFTAGLLRPVTVISASLQRALSASEMEAIVAHENAHLRARDNLRWLVAEACATLLMVTPTAWYYRRKLREALEAAADDAAIAGAVPVDTLASALAAAGRATRARPASPSLAALLIPMPAMIDQRSARLAAADADEMTEPNSSLQAIIAAATGVALVALLLLVARDTVNDTLYCAVEQWIAAIG